MWTVEIERDADPGPGICPPEVRPEAARREYSTEAEAVTAAKRAAIPGWFVTITTPDGESFGI